MNLDMGIKGSNNEPRAQIKWHDKSMRMGIVQHDKDDGDINGTIGVTATFVYAKSPRSGPLSTTQSVAMQLHCKVTPLDIAGSWLRAVFGAL
jgi:hypothetical protein